MAEGLSSREAQERLLEELSRLISGNSTTSWAREVKRNPFTILCNAAVGVAGMLLMLHFAVAASDRTTTIFFQGLFLLLLAGFNMALFGWEVYILRTQKLRHLLVRLKPLFDGPCPWSASDYPKAPISTLRGHLTVPTYRDGALVNVPISLLVRGDIMELDSGVPSPANATLLGEAAMEESETGSGSGNSRVIHVAADEVLPDRLFRDKHQPEATGEEISFLPEARSVRLLVEDTPILGLLEPAVKRVSTSNFLTKESNCTFCMVHVVVIGVLYGCSLLVNLIRYFSLQDDFQDSWSQLILGNPVYTCLPILFIQFPLVWSVTNLYGTARIGQLVECGPTFFRATGLERVRVFFKTLLTMGKLVFLFSHYPDYRVFHVLGTLTSVCAVDKEYLLTSGFPSPERVFFLRTEEVAGEAGRKGGAGGGGSEKGGRAHGWQQQHPEPEPRNLASSKMSAVFSSCPKIKVDDISHSDDNIAARSTLPQFQRSVSTDSSKVRAEVPEEERQLRPLPSPQLDTFSTLSTLSASFEVVTEIFNLSPDPTSYSGIAFDEINWHHYLNSLKPIGVNLLATSHLSKTPFYLSPSGHCNELRLHLHKSSCSCSLSAEIGVAEFFPTHFRREVLVHTLSDPILDYQRATRRRSTATTFITHNSSIIQPHVISTVVREHSSDKTLVMSRGSGDLIASCCTDFWDGKDLQPMSVMERESIVDYYNCRSLSSYCVALAYAPLPDLDLSELPGDEIGIFLPPGHLERTHANFSTGGPVTPRSQRPLQRQGRAEVVFKSLQCNQVFLGLVCLQFRPKQDMVLLIEDLYAAGIRFVHFTAENELQAKIFAQKLGLEADWNCFISLAQPEKEEDEEGEGEGEGGGDSCLPAGKGEEEEEEEKEEAATEGSGSGGDGPDDSSSLSSSVMSVFQSTISHIRARLPKGIKNIRPHIQKVDNVPLLVSLFTDCTAETITEMIQIMQENSEVVLCIGNAWNHKNVGVFSQADISLGLVPRHVDLTRCSVTETCALSTSNSSSQFPGALGPPPVDDVMSWPAPLELASYLNSTSCQLCFGRDCEVSLLSLITESRRIISSIRLGLLFLLGASLTLSLLLLLSTLLFLPPPLNGGHLLWLLVFVLPLIVLSFLSTPLDEDLRRVMPDKKKDLFSNKCLLGTELLLIFGSTALLLLLLFGLVLREVCLNDITNSTCHLLLGDRTGAQQPHPSPWNGWGVGGQAEQGLLLAQDVTAFFTSLYMVFLSVRFIHRTRPLWRLWHFTSWQYLVVAMATVLLQLLYSVLSQVSVRQNSQVETISGLDSVPAAAWVLGLAWPAVVLASLEVLKYIDKKKLFEAQTLLRLQFGTKLGMHSPV